MAKSTTRKTSTTTTPKAARAKPPRGDGGSARAARAGKGGAVPAPAPAAPPAAASPAPAPRPPTCLDAAHAALVRAGTPMRVTELMAKMQADGLWRSPQGKTPEATLAAALIREIARKGESTRFVRVDRGLFAAR